MSTAPSDPQTRAEEAPKPEPETVKAAAKGAKAAQRPNSAAGEASAAATAGASAMEAAGDTMWRRGLAFNEEAARFAARRADRYREFFEELACCASPLDAAHAAQRAAQASIQDYMDEFGRMSGLAMSPMQDADGDARAAKR